MTESFSQDPEAFSTIEMIQDIEPKIRSISDSYKELNNLISPNLKLALYEFKTEVETCGERERRMLPLNKVKNQPHIKISDFEAKIAKSIDKAVEERFKKICIDAMKKKFNDYVDKTVKHLKKLYFNEYNDEKLVLQKLERAMLAEQAKMKRSENTPYIPLSHLQSSIDHQSDMISNALRDVSDAIEVLSLHNSPTWNNDSLRNRDLKVYTDTSFDDERDLYNVPDLTNKYTAMRCDATTVMMSLTSQLSEVETMWDMNMTGVDKLRDKLKSLQSTSAGIQQVSKHNVEHMLELLMKSDNVHEDMQMARQSCPFDTGMYAHEMRIALDESKGSMKQVKELVDAIDQYVNLLELEKARS